MTLPKPVVTTLLAACLLSGPGAAAGAAQVLSSLLPVENTRALDLPGKSPAKALLLSVGHTVVASGVGIAALRWSERENDMFGFPAFTLATYGFIVAPSIGSYYADDHRRALTGFAIRAAGGACLLTSLLFQILPEETEAGEWDTSWKWDRGGVAGLALIAGGTVYSFVSAPRAAEEFNRRRVEETRISLTPAIDPATGALGLRVGWQF